MRSVCAWTIAMLFATASVRAQYIFGPPEPLTAPTPCRPVIAFVPRADQKLSLAALATNGGSVCVFRGDGFGGFGACEPFATGAGALGLAPGDTSLDLRADFLLPISAANGLAIMKQLDPGGFTPGQAVFAGGPATCALAADLDDDGDTDVVVAYSSTPALRVLLNNGAGNLAPAATLQLPAVATAMAANDLTGDGLLELLAVCTNVDSLSILPNVGGGAFAARVDFAAGSRPNAVAVAVLDTVAAPGLAIADANSGAVTILPGAGPLQFGPTRSLPVGLQPVVVLASDLDRNDRIELIAPLGGAAAFAVLSRSTQGVWSLQTYPLPARAAGAAIGDFDNDGDDDLAFSLVGEPGLRLIENRSSVDPCRADFDRDGAVAFSDITRILALWMSDGRHDDPNDDGVIDFADITFVLARWGRACGEPRPR